MQSRSLLLVAGALLFGAIPAQAQSRWQITVQGGPAVPLEKLNGVDLKTGAGFEGTVGYQIHPRLSLYAGWDWHRFVVQWPARPFAGNARELEETGYALGARYTWPLQAEGPVSLILRAGGTLNHFEAEDDAGKGTENSGHGLGWEAGAGLGIALTRHWQVAPVMRVRMISRDLTIDDVKRESRLTYLALEAAVSYRF